MTSSVFFMRAADAGSPVADDYGGEFEGQQTGMASSAADYYAARQLALGPATTVGQYNKMVPMGYQVITQFSPFFTSTKQSQQASPMPMKFDDFSGQQHVPRYCYAPSEVTSIP